MSGMDATSFLQWSMCQVSLCMCRCLYIYMCMLCILVSVYLYLGRHVNLQICACIHLCFRMQFLALILRAFCKCVRLQFVFVCLYICVYSCINIQNYVSIDNSVCIHLCISMKYLVQIIMAFSWYQCVKLGYVCIFELCVQESVMCMYQCVKLCFMPSCMRICMYIFIHLYICLDVLLILYIYLNQYKNIHSHYSTQIYQFYFNFNDLFFHLSLYIPFNRLFKFLCILLNKCCLRVFSSSSSKYAHLYHYINNFLFYDVMLLLLQKTITSFF